MPTRIYVMLAAVLAVVAVILVPPAIMQVFVAPVPYGLAWVLVGWWLGRDGDKRWNGLAVTSAVVIVVFWVMWLIQGQGVVPEALGWGMRIAAGLSAFVLLAGLARWVATQPSMVGPAPEDFE